VCIIAVAGVVLWRGVFSDGSILGTGIAPGGRSETEEVAQESSKSKSSGATIAEGRSETEDAIQESSGSKSSQATIAGERYKPDKTSLNLYGVALTDEDLVQMQQLKSVTSLSIRDCTLENAGAGEVFWDYVTGLIQLHYLQLSGSPDLLSYAVGAGRAPELAGCANLESLYLNDCGLTDISFLDGMGALWWLELDGNQVADIGPLAGLTKLTHLSLEGNQIEDITPLAGLTKLTHLSLAGNQIEDIAPLAGLTGITHLSLAGNRVEDVGPLSGMTKVQELYLNGNKIADVSGMTNCAVLTHVNLADNRISDIDFLKKSMGSLLEADVSRNQIGDETFRTAFGDMEALRTLLADGNLLQFADTAFDFTLSLGGMADATSDDPRAISLMRFLESVPEIAEYDEGANRVTGRLHGLDLAAFHLPALRTLSLADNELAGFDFAGINSSQMPLQSLNLSGNRLEAALDIPFTTVLTTLDLSHNGIQWVSGVLESGEGGQVAAYAGRGIELNLGYNALTAPFVMLPVSLSYTTLWLDHNALDAASYGALASLAATSPKRLHIDFLADPNNPNGDMDLTGVAASPFSYIYLYGTPRDQQEKVRAGLRGKIQEIVE
jgi:Leucine-rich repeat (LRR) protein